MMKLSVSTVSLVKTQINITLYAFGIYLHKYKEILLKACIEISNLEVVFLLIAQVVWG